MTDSLGCGGGICWASAAFPKPVEDPADKAFREAVAELVDCAMKEGKPDA
ncbi:hypothetical protein JMM59_19495 [Rhodovulum sulfidophilum]|nr:hypothetical protein [Rhodovulum sulfidophilum]